MIKQSFENLKATWIFAVVRIVASLLVGLVYLLVAANIQYWFVLLFGETTFNYVFGGLISLFLSIYVSYVLGRLLYMFIRGWHMAALAYATRINKEHLPALDVGMVVFKKHFTSFAVVYSTSLLIRKFADKGVDELWELLKDVPYVGNLREYSRTPIVVSIGKNLLDTAFDAVVYYIVKYTKPGLSDDATVLGEALKRYLYALPQVLLTSAGMFLVLQILPKVTYFFTVVSIFLHNGIVAGILINVLVFPLFYILRHGICDTLEMVLLMSCYSKHCTEEPVNEENGIFKALVDKMLEAAGLDFTGQDKSEVHAPTTAKADDTPPTPSTTEAEDEEEEEHEILPNFAEDGDLPNVADLPLQEELDMPLPMRDPVRSVFAAANDDILQAPSAPPGFADIIGLANSVANKDSEEQETESPVSRLHTAINKLSPEAISRMLSASDCNEEDDSNVIGGDDLDFQ